MRNTRAIDILNKNARTFSFAGKILGRETMQKAAVLYYFCRTLDDMADRAVTEADKQSAMIKLEHVGKDLEYEYSEVAPVRDFLQLARTEDIDIKIAQDLLTGVTGDLQTVRIQNEDELLTYCYRVAGTVGLMMCPVLGCRNENAYRHAIALGIAMQLTNIARDIQEDALQNRIYIPQSMLPVNDPKALTVHPDTEGGTDARDSCRAILDMAEEFYSYADKGLSALPWRPRLSILVASRLYREIGRKLAENGYAYWEGRTIVSNKRKFPLTTQCVIEFLMNKKMKTFIHEPPPQHYAKFLENSTARL